MEQTDLDNLEWRRRRLNCVGIIRWFTSSISVRVRWLRWRGTAAMMECYYRSNVMCWYREQSPHPDLCHREDHLNNHYGNKARLLVPSHPDLLHGVSCLVVLGEARGSLLWHLASPTWSVAAWCPVFMLWWPQVRRGAETRLVSHSRTAADH